MLDWPYIALLATGALAAGFVNGLAGFGTALFSLGFWLQIMPPVQAVALGVATSTATGIQGLWVVRHQIAANPRRLMRFLIPAIIGIPFGIAALNFLDPTALKLLIAGFMLLYGVFFLVRRKLPQFERRTPGADMGIGLAGGVLGGLAGLSGALPAMWCALRPWPRAETRAVLQPFNVVILGLTTLILAFRGAYTAQARFDLAIVLVLGLIAAQVGIITFRRMTDTQFRWLLIVLMFASGAILLLREAL